MHHLELAINGAKRPAPHFEPGMMQKQMEMQLIVPDTPVLDYASVPHIVDQIAGYLPFGELLAWRGLCRRYRDLLDVTVLRTTFRQLECSDNNDDECMVQIPTGGSLVAEISCQSREPDVVGPIHGPPPGPGPRDAAAAARGHPDWQGLYFLAPNLQALYDASASKRSTAPARVPPLPFAEL